MVWEKQLYLYQMEDPVETRVQGLSYYSNFIQKQQHNSLIQTIDMQPWEHSFSRRVQQYGYKYDYKSRTINASSQLSPLPFWADQLASLFHRESILNSIPNQVIVNEYLPGQGIASHIDRESCFGEEIAILSLGSPIVMNFNHTISKQRYECWLKPNSLIILKGPARYYWKHGIAARKTDRFEGSNFRRGRRISLTFRRSLLETR